VPGLTSNRRVLPHVFLSLLLVSLLAACGHTPVTRTLAEAFGRGIGAESVALNPKFRYLRVVANGREALMVLGYVDENPAGPIETWYSNAGEVLRLQNGRILATTGLKVDWRSVRYADVPSWSSMLQQSSARFIRERDEMPGYRFGIRELISLYPINPPADARLLGISAKSLIWLEEKVQGTRHELPSARFGLRQENGAVSVVYGEQCVAQDLCIAWQSWPVTKP